MGEILKYFGGYGLSPWMVFILVLIIVVSYFYKKQIQDWLSSFVKRKNKKENKISDLKNHDLFNTLQRVKQEVKVLKFYTDGEIDVTKIRMCQDFTNFKCDICSNAFHKFIEEDLEALSYDELKSKMLNDMWQMHNDYIAAIKNHWLDKNIQKEDVDYVVELFERFRYDVVQSFQNRIDAIFASSYHKTKFEKVLGCYDMFAMGIDLLPKDLQTTFETLNGRFKKIKY